MVAEDFGFLEAEDGFGVGADGERFGGGVGDEVSGWEGGVRRGELLGVAGEFFHGGGADEPGGDFEFEGGGFEEVGEGFSVGEMEPAFAEDFGVEGGTHVAGDVGARHGGLRGEDVGGNLQVGGGEYYWGSGYLRVGGGNESQSGVFASR